MKHTDHPNWKNLSPREKHIVRVTNYKKVALNLAIKNIEKLISSDKKENRGTFYLEGVLNRKKVSLENNPFDNGNIYNNYTEDLKNLQKDKEKV
tara:strand:+ start:233 stop:514 length:282 start_codon:yes stop_codon:yes gene_type:complete